MIARPSPDFVDPRENGTWLLHFPHTLTIHGNWLKNFLINEHAANKTNSKKNNGSAHQTTTKSESNHGYVFWLSLHLDKMKQWHPRCYLLPWLGIGQTCPLYLPDSANASNSSRFAAKFVYPANLFCNLNFMSSVSYQTITGRMIRQDHVSYTGHRFAFYWL